MTENDPSLGQRAGYWVFPRSRDELISTSLCPACHHRLTSALCGNCQLDLNHPAAIELATVSADAAALLDRRIEIIGQMRFDTAAALAEQTAAATVAAAKAAEARQQLAHAAAAQATVVADPFTALIAPLPVAPPVVTRTPKRAAPAREPSVPRRSSIQVLLLIAGISLVSVAAVFFLVYAFINYGLVWRSVIIGSITVAAFIVASVLRRRQYAGTAEGIAVFAVVLVYLDAFAVKANNLFGVGSADDLVYWGTTLVISSVLFVVWHRRTALRVGSIVGFATFAPGLGLLVAGLTGPLDTPTRFGAALAAIGLAGLVHPFATARGSANSPATTQVPERVIALAIAAVGLLGAFVSSFFVAPDFFWAPAIALGATALIALAHVALIIASKEEDQLVSTFAVAIAGLGGVAAAAAIGATGFREPSLAFGMIAPAVAAALVAASLDIVLHRTLVAHAAPAARAARLAALIVTGLALLAPVTVALFLSGEVVVTGFVTDNWALQPTDLINHPTEQQLSAIVALGVVTLIAVGASAASGALRRRLTALSWPVLLTAVLAVPLLSVLWAVLAGWFVFSGIALALIVRVVRREQSVTLSAARLAPLAVVAVAAGVLAYFSAWGSTNTWHVATMAAAALVLVARLAIRRGRAVLLAVAIVVVFVGALAAASYFDLTRSVELTVVVLDALRLLGITATLIAAAAAVPAIPTLTATDRKTMFWTAAPVAFGTGIATWLMLGIPERVPHTLLPEFGSSLGASVALLAALTLWTAVRANVTFRAERAFASALLAPVAWWLVDSLTRTLGLADFPLSIAAATAVLIVSAAALLGSGLGRPVGAPWARELGIAIVAVPVLVGAALLPTDVTWLVFIMAAVATLLLSISSDGLFGSRSQRKHLGWLALALATAGLWWRLSGAEIVSIEAYVLPLAGALLLIALLIWRTAQRSAEPSGSRTAPLVALAGLLVAILPLSLDAIASEPVRAVTLFAISAAALLVGSLVRASEKLRPYLDVLAIAGAAGTVVLLIGRSVFLGQGANRTGVESDLWLAAGLLVLLAASWGQSLARGTQPSPLRRYAGEALGLVGLSTVLVAEISGFTSEQYGTARAWATLVLFCVLYLVSALVKRAPFTAILGWTSLGFAVISALAAVTTESLGAFEVAIVATALAAIAAVPQIALPTIDRRLLFWLGITVALLSGLVGWRLSLDAMGAGPDRILSLVASAALVLALVLWAAIQKESAVRIERIAAATAIAPSVFLLVDSVSRLLDLADTVVQLAPVSSALLVAAGALAVAVRQPASVPRWALEIGIAVVAVPATVMAILADSPSTWLVLVLAGATALLSAIGAGGLFGSTSPRKHVGWLALALATAGLWWRLAGNEITAVELYVLPLAGSLLLVALLVWNSDRTTAQGEAAARNAAPLIAFGGLLVAILPIALNAATGPLERALAIGLTCAALALLGSLVKATPRLRPYLDAAALAGMLGVLVLATGRSLFAAPNRGSLDITLDAWVGAAFLVLVIAAFGQSMPRPGESTGLRLAISQVLGLAGLTVVLGFEVVSFTDYGVGQIRAVVVLLLFSAVHLIALAVNRVPLGRTLGWVAFGYAAIVAVAGRLENALNPIEMASVPLALALLGTGVIHLDRTPAARSWPTLGPGMLLLLVPSLIWTFEDAPLWRLVAIGVVAVAAIVIGLVRQLQAPFIIGVVVAVIHGFRTFVPQLQNAYQATEWWVWAGIGGIVLVVLAARYEKSVRTLRTTITRIGQLR